MLKLAASLLIFGAISLAPAAACARQTQIVVQWLDSESHVQPLRLFELQSVFDDHADEYGYVSDGNDVGGGTNNFYLYADDRKVDDVVRHVIAMRGKKLLPDGMRIGVAVYKNPDRRDWIYHPVYPATLKEFNITYSRPKKPN